MNLRQLLEYDQWANQRIFQAIRTIDQPEIDPEIIRLFSHLLTAQVVWLNRIQQKPLPPEIWPVLSFEKIEEHLEENPTRLRSLIPQKEEVIHYKNSKGDEFKNSVEEILVHLTIHGQHHRAQIASLLRKAGITPPGTDFIFFLRTLDN